MARRRSDIAGLAALAALGYGLYNSKKKEEEARKKPAAAETRSSEPTITSDMRKRAEEEGGRLSPGEMAAMSGPAIRPEGPAPSPVKTSTPRQKPEQVSLAAKYEKPKMQEQTHSRKMGAYEERRDQQAPAKAASAPRTTPSMPLKQQLTQTTLGKPIAPDPDAPSIYDDSETWASYRQQQEAKRAAQPPTPQGSARNIMQQMREKDKSVLAAVRRRQDEEEAAAQLAREADAERRREARQVEPTSGALENPYYGRTGEQRTAALRAKGGTVKSRAPAKPAAKGWGKARGARQAKYY